MLKTEAIKVFLDAKSPSDLANLYSLGMECQVNVARDGGDPIKGEYMGKQWKGWTDGCTVWKSFRIPWNSMSDPDYLDSEMKWDLEKHADAIGMTGWNWQRQRSIYVAYDFDAIIGHSDKHSKKLSNQELDDIKEAAETIPWITIRRSTSGTGLHLYVFLDPNSKVEVKNHTEHSALARAILGKMSALCGFNFDTKVDICGGNMWVWARKAEGTNGLTCMKQGEHLKDSEIPTNWRDHVNVVSGRSRRSRPSIILEEKRLDTFDALCTSRNVVALDDQHKAVIKYLEESGSIWSYDPDSNMVVTHVYMLKKAHMDLNLKGIFETSSSGKNLDEQNCFMFPMRGGSWVVRRFSPGVNEHDCWDQDGNGWTRTYLNKDPDFRTACRACGGIEDTRGGFFFIGAEDAEKAALILGTSLRLAPEMSRRECTLKQHKDGRLIAEVERKEADTKDMAPSYLPKKNLWTRVVNISVTTVEEPESANYDDVIRHIVSPGHSDYGWVAEATGHWIQEPLAHVRPLLSSFGYSDKEIKVILGNCISRPWTLVNKPFQPEYPGGREWNKTSAQLRYSPSGSGNPKHPTWDSVLAHTGSGFDDAVTKDPWCRAAGIEHGGDYLKYWVAALIQYPEESLPYLFFYNPQEKTGKSIFHESLKMLFTSGCIDASSALMNESHFNGELEGAVLCYIEEIDLTKGGKARNKIKDWVTSDTILIHPKGQTPYGSVNTTHWVHCANSHMYCPIFKGDTRISMGFVRGFELGQMIPKMMLKDRLIKEAPDFLQTITTIEIPEPDDRLRIPVLNTDDKALVQEINQTQLERFIDVKCTPVDGAMILMKTFCDRFREFLPADEAASWTNRRVGREIPPYIPKGRRHADGNFCFGNICFNEDANDERKEGDRPKLVVSDKNFLDPV